MNYSKADWQQKNTDTWLSSESRHDRVEPEELAVPLDAGAAVVGGDVDDDGAAIWDLRNDGLTLMVPVFETDGSLKLVPLLEVEAVNVSSK